MTFKPLNALKADDATSMRTVRDSAEIFKEKYVVVHVLTQYLVTILCIPPILQDVHLQSKCPILGKRIFFL